MKHLFESSTGMFLQNDDTWAESAPSYIWGDEDEFQMNGMNHSTDCPCRRKNKFSCTMCGNVITDSADAQEMVAWCENCSDNGESLTEEEEEMRRVKFTRI